jgi:hypothetical protein
MFGDGSRNSLQGWDGIVRALPNRKQRTDAQRYREQADYYAQLAGTATSPTVREQLQKVAETYLRLAEQLDTLPDLP